MARQTVQGTTPLTEHTFDVSGGALPLSPTHSDDLSAAPGTSDETLCPRCHTPATITRKHPVCKPCYAALEQEAQTQQEHDALRCWLNSRVDERGLPREDSALTFTPAERATILRLCAKARRLELDWTEIPPYQTLAARMKALLTPYLTNGHDSHQAA